MMEQNNQLIYLNSKGSFISSPLKVIDPQLRDVMASLEEKSHADAHTEKRPMEAMSRN
jgi:hypothetical protein